MRILICAAVALVTAWLPMQAQDDNILRQFSLSAGVGTTGVTVDLGTMVTDFIGLRGGIDIMPKFKYSTKLSLSQINQTVNADMSLIPDNMRQAKVQGTLHNTTGHALVDIYPFAGRGFHLTVGAYFAGSEKIVMVECKENELMKKLANLNARRGPYAAIPDSYGQAAVKLGDYNIMPDDEGNANAYIHVKKVRPYVGLGFGRAVPSRSRLGCLVDLGVQLSGKPRVYNGVNSEELTSEGAKGEDGGILKTISSVRVYPAVTVRLVGRIF